MFAVPNSYGAAPLQLSDVNQCALQKPTKDGGPNFHGFQIYKTRISWTTPLIDDLELLNQPMGEFPCRWREKNEFLMGFWNKSINLDFKEWEQNQYGLRRMCFK